MPLKQPITRPHKSCFINALSYRIPRPVQRILLLSDGECFPICPRCGTTLDREYICFCDRCGQRLAWAFFHFASVSRPKQL